VAGKNAIPFMPSFLGYLSKSGQSKFLSRNPEANPNEIMQCTCLPAITIVQILSGHHSPLRYSTHLPYTNVCYLHKIIPFSMQCIQKSHAYLMLVNANKLI